MMTDYNKQKLSLATLLVLAVPAMSWAITPMDDSQLSDVVGQDGLTLSYGSDSAGITAQQLIYSPDNNDTVTGAPGAITACSASGPNCAYAVYEDLSLKPIGANGAAALPTDRLNFALQIDADADQVAIELDWDRARLELARISHQDSYLGYQNAGNASFGNFAMDSSGHFHLRGGQDLLSNSTATNVELNIGNVGYSGGIGSYNRVSAGDGQIFFRQGGVAGTPELSMDNVGLLFSMPQGTVALDANGLQISGPAALFDLTFDLRYDPTGASPFAMDANDRSILFFGWRGTWLEPELSLWGAGSWPGGVYNEGISASLKMNWDSDYKVIVGEAGASAGGMYLEFGDATPLPYADGVVPSLATAKDFEVPLIALDVIHASQGPGGLCYGLDTTTAGVNGIGGGACSGAANVSAQLNAQQINIAPENNAFAILGRDWAIRAYSGTVQLFGPAPADNVAENWALIYTFGDNDGNIYLYPQTSTAGVAGSNAGMKADVMITTQTFGTTAAERWRRGTHFMIADTDRNLGIGLVGVDAALIANDLYISTLASGLQFSSNQVRFNMRGMIGGGDIPNLAQPQNITYADMNLESDNFVFTLEPAPPGQDYLGYSAFISLAPYNYVWAGGNAGFADDLGGAHGHDDGSYFSLAEPNTRSEGTALDDKLNVDFRLARIEGDIEFANGKIDLQSANETANGRPQLLISNDIYLGRAATIPGGGTGDILRIGAVEFGAQTLGQIVIPQAQITASITLKQQY